MQYEAKAHALSLEYVAAAPDGPVTKTLKTPLTAFAGF